MKKSLISASLILMSALSVNAQRSQGLVPDINSKSWERLLMEDRYTWQPPQSVNMLVEPLFSPDQIFVNPSLVAYRGRIPEGVSSQDSTRFMAESQPDLTVQFALGDPAFMPDYRQTGLRFEDNRYPVVNASYYADNILYEFTYASTRLDADQTILDIHVQVTNKEEFDQEVSVWTKIGFCPENEMFTYHYISYEWDASYWKDTGGVSLQGSELTGSEGVLGRMDPGDMQMEWVEDISFDETQFLRKSGYYFNRSGYVGRPYRLYSLRDVIRLHRRLSPEESCCFDVKLLMNDGHVTAGHREALASMDASDIKSKALEGYKAALGGDAMELVFPAMEWDDIAAYLQLNIMQMLLRHPGREWLQTGQGGSSERFYVWVFEAVQMLRPLLRTGQLDVVRRSLDFIFSLQDGGYPPEGDFTTLEGAVGTTGPRWANTTGMALDLASEYYLYSGDEAFLQEYLPKILKAVHWIAGEVKATRRLNPDGSHSMTYGLMPFAVGGDGEKGYFVGTTDLFTFLGFYKTVDLLERIGHPEAQAMRAELELYRAAMHEAIERLTMPSGQISRVLRPDGSQGRIARINEYVDTMAPVATMGLVDPESGLFQNFIRFYELNAGEDFFMGKLDRERYYIVQGENYWQQIYLELGEWKKAWGVARAAMKYGITQDMHLVQERYSLQDPSFCPWQPNGSGSGGVINMILNSICYESERLSEVILLGGTPFEYLASNGITSLKRLRTANGMIDLEITCTDSDTLEMTLSSPDALPSRIRIPEHFHTRLTSKGYRKVADGVFETSRELKTATFRLTR